MNNIKNRIDIRQFKLLLIAFVNGALKCFNNKGISKCRVNILVNLQNVFSIFA